MKPRMILILFVAPVLTIACSSPGKKARQELAAMGLEWSEASFFRCIRQNRAEAVRLFLQSGMSADKSEGGYTALLESVRRGYDEISLDLIDARADVNSKDGFGVTALMFAVICGSPDVIQGLIEHGADINARDVDGRTALAEALTTENDIPFATLKSLVDAGADVNVRFQSGLTPLMVAAGGDPQIVRLLLQAGADVNASDDYGATALQRAKDNPENSEILRAAGAKK